MKSTSHLHRLSLPLLLLVAGCAATSPPPGGNDNTGNANSNENDNSQPVDLTAEQAKAVALLSESLTGTSAAVFGLFPGADTADFLSQFEDAPPDCPTVTTSLDDGLIVQLDYGTACNPALYPPATLSGRVAAAIENSTGLLSFGFEDFSLDDFTLNGTLSAAKSVAGGVVTFDATLDLTLEGVGTIRGDFLLSFGTRTAETTLVSATLTLTDDQDFSVMASLADVLISPVTYQSFRPYAGSAVFDVANPGPGPETITVTVVFTEQTPEDGTVIVTAGNGEPIEYTPPG